MRLNEDDVKLFYKLNWSLLFYTNQKYPVIHGLNSPNFKGYDLNKVAKLHEKLYSHPEIIDSFISENPFGFNQEELNIIQSWKNFVNDEFIIVTHLKEYTIFLGSDKELKAYGVLGLYDKLEDIFPYLPIMIETILLPFKGKIIYDGVFSSYNINFGGGIKKSIHADYQKAKSIFGIITSLEQPITKKEESEEELLKFYLKSKDNRREYNDEINKILRKNPLLLKLYYQELGKSNTREVRKRLSELGVINGWFAVFNDTVIASGNNEAEVKNQINKIVPEHKRDYIYLFRYVKK